MNCFAVPQVIALPYRITPQCHELAGDPSFPYREDLLQFIWEQGLFDGRDLCTTEGHRIDVVRAGSRQFNSGPDLLDAALRINGQRWSGTVEVHVRSSEWNAHGHHRDPAYENVILHVVWIHDMEVRTVAGHRPPTVELRSRVDALRLAAFERLFHGRGRVPCAGDLGAVPRSTIERSLEEALSDRMERKVAEVMALHARSGHDHLETVHQVLLRAFGGLVNAEACAMVAQALPVRTLLKVRDDEVRLEALLFGQAGMLGGELVDAYAKLLQREYAMLARLHDLAPVPSPVWKYGRLRPSAFPSLRLAQFARLIARCGDNLVASVMEGDIHALRARFAVCAGPYWLDRHRFDRPSALEPKRLGADAVDHVLINAVVPLRAALAPSKGGLVRKRTAIELLRSLPAERNATIRGWAKVGIRVSDAAGSQALLELWKTKCGQRACLSCVIGRKLLSRTDP